MSELIVPALEVKQRPGRSVYVFGMDGKLIPRIATIWRIQRMDGVLIGYQRPEAYHHTQQIADYLQSEEALVPNSVVIAFDRRVRFVARGEVPGDTQPGELVIPMCEPDADLDKPGFVVDGQQRVAAIREANVERFPIAVSAFVAVDSAMQREQFIRVNHTLPVAKGLLYELLPLTTTSLPPRLERKRTAAGLMVALNTTPWSPFFGRIRTVTNPEGIVQDTSILRMVANSLSDGLLYELADESARLSALAEFWTAVAETWPTAWREPPRKSRLTHGAGILALGLLMDAVGERHRGRRPAWTANRLDFRADLELVRPLCAWTEGAWNFGAEDVRGWRDVQNTTRDIGWLSTQLYRAYRARVEELDRAA